ncbi:MAG: corrinoid protein [Proteobacteria bacterium]|nr:corrinoid protein [Pseudomonadota bacterium]
MSDILPQIAQALQRGDAPGVGAGVQEALDQGLSPRDILDKALVATMAVIGHKFKNNEMYMPEVMIAARAMNAGLEILDPILSRSGASARGKLLLGSVRGDLHDVGKNMVSMMFRGAGFKVIDLGVDVAEDKFVAAVHEHRPDVVGLSALLTMTLSSMETTLTALKYAGLRDRVVVLCGGAPVTEDFALRVGADGYAPDAASAVERALELMAQRRGEKWTE